MTAAEVKDLVRWLTEDGRYKYAGIDTEVSCYLCCIIYLLTIFIHSCVLMTPSSLLAVMVLLTSYGLKYLQQKVVQTLRSSVRLLQLAGFVHPPLHCC